MRIGRPEAEHGDGRAVGKRRPQRVECLRPDQRRIAIDDENIVRRSFDRGFGREHRMRRAAPLLLHEDRGIRQNALGFGGDGVLSGTDDDGAAVTPASATAASTCASSDCPAIACSTFGRGRAHAGALAGREHDRKAVRAFIATSAALS